MILETINHITVEGLGFKPMNYIRNAGAETYVRGGVMVTIDQSGGVQAIINGSLVPDINLQKLILFLKRP